MTTRRPDRRI